MTSIAPAETAERIARSTVTVANHQLAGLDDAALQARLDEVEAGANWNVGSSDRLDHDVIADVVVCPAAVVAAAVIRHPGAAVIAVFADDNDGQAVLAALRAGATTCISGYAVNIVAAFVLALARRRELVS